MKKINKLWYFSGFIMQFCYCLEMSEQILCTVFLLLYVKWVFDFFMGFLLFLTSEGSKILYAYNKLF